MRAYVRGDSVTNIQPFEATPEEFDQLMAQAATHDLRYNSDTKHLTAVPKSNNPSTPASE